MLALNVSLTTAELSAARTQLIAGGDPPRGKEVAGPATDAGSESASRFESESKPTAAKELTPEQQRQVAELARIDLAVRAHEAAHLRVGAGVVTSGANFSYTYGPDGRSYAVAGEVGIDTAPEDEPEANIDKGQRIQIVALAPAEPSPQDYRIAAIGGRIEQMGHSGVAQRQALEQAENAGAHGEEQTGRGGGTAKGGSANGAAGELTRELLFRHYLAPSTGGEPGLSLFA